MVPEYLVLSSSPWTKIPVKSIERIDYPPIDDMRCQEFGYIFTAPKATCIVLTDGREIWSKGDQTWREKAKKERLDAAYYRFIDAKKNYQDVLNALS